MPPPVGPVVEVEFEVELALGAETVEEEFVVELVEVVEEESV
jgi:hypothetical protein